MKLMAIEKKMEHSQRSYLKELMRLKDQARKLGRQKDDKLGEFDEDIEFFDGTQFFDDATKKLIKQIVSDRVKTAVIRAMDGKLPPELLSEYGSRRGDGQERKSDGFDHDANMKELQAMREALEEEAAQLRKGKEDAELGIENERRQREEIQDRLQILPELYAQIQKLEDDLDHETKEKESWQDEKMLIEEEFSEKTAQWDQERANFENMIAELQEEITRVKVEMMALEAKFEEMAAKGQEEAAEEAERRNEMFQEQDAAHAADMEEAEAKYKSQIDLLEMEISRNEVITIRLIAERRDVDKQLNFEILKRKEIEAKHAQCESFEEALRAAQEQTELVEEECMRLRKELTEAEILLADLQGKIEQFVAAGEQSGMGAQIAELLVKSGLKGSGVKSPRSVFDRLYSDALARYGRMEQMRLRMLELQRDALLKVLANKVLDPPPGDVVWNQESKRDQVRKSKVVKRRKAKKYILTDSSSNVESDAFNNWALFFRDDPSKSSAVNPISLTAVNPRKGVPQKGLLEKSKSAPPLPRLTDTCLQSSSFAQILPEAKMGCSTNLKINTFMVNDQWENRAGTLSPGESMNEDEMKKFGMQKAKRKNNGRIRGEQDYSGNIEDFTPLKLHGARQAPFPVAERGNAIEIERRVQELYQNPNLMHFRRS